MTSAKQASGSATGSASTVPIIAGMFPDPSVCRVGEDYFLANSSLEYTPAVPIWHSTDLVNWVQIGNALDREDQFPAGRSPASRGIYAPTLRHHDGRFWLITTDIDHPRGGHQLYAADNPAGPWSPPVCIDQLDGIDPDLAWDEKGTCLVTYCSWDDNRIGIKQAAIDPRTGVLLTGPKWIWHGTGLSHPEGPHLYRRGSWWYLVIAEGGTDRGHVVSAARSHSPQGPFDADPANPVLTHRSIRHPVQNVGHADLVERPDGTWAAVHLGTQPRGGTPRYHVNGRETFLAEVNWIDGWPRFTPMAAEPPAGQGTFEDDFKQPALNHRWISPGTRLADFITLTPEGVEIAAAPAGAGGVSGLFVRARGEYWQADFTVDPRGAEFTVGVRIDDQHWYGIRTDDGRAEVRAVIGQLESSTSLTVLPEGPVIFRIRSTEATSKGPDDIELAIVIDQGEQVLKRLDGRYLSTEVASGFTGRVLGLWTTTGSPALRRVKVTERSSRSGGVA